MSETITVVTSEAIPEVEAVQGPEVEENKAIEPEETVNEKKPRLREVIDMGGGAVKCVLCEKRSYMAETIMFDKLPYHRECFLCTICKDKLPNTIRANRFEDDIYCTTCFNQQGFATLQLTSTKWVKKTSTGPSTLPAGIGGGANPCNSCGKGCYPAEGATFGGKLYHKDCMRCDDCKRLCNLADCNRFEEKFYCTVCWNKGEYNQKQLASRGHSHSPSMSVSTAIPTTPCVKCEKQCYPAEGATFGGKLYHRDCMRCNDCTRLCTLADCNRFEDNLYCTVCWNKGEYNQKQLASRKHTHTPSMSTSTAVPTTPCVKCTKQCYPAEGATFGGKLYHRDCMRCTECNHLCTLADCNRFEDDLFCNVCWNKGEYNQKQLAARKHTHTPSMSTSTAAPTTPCVKCEKQCYPAEGATFGGKLYHRDCMRCNDCTRLCTLADCNRFEDNLYCTVCWNKGEYNQKQLASRKHTHTPSMSTSMAVPTTPCVKCTKQCYPAEGATFGGKLYHRDCMRCTECNHLCTLADCNRFEDDLFCNVCWNKGGYNKRQLASRGHGPSPSVSSAPVTNPCTKCSKQCYAAEGTTISGKLYHRDCVRCADCRRSALVDCNRYGEEFYCNVCWDRGDFARKQVNESKWNNTSGAQNTTPVVSSDAAAAAASTTPAPEAEPAKSYSTCHKCSKKVYPGEKTMWNDVLYHSKCLTCTNCGLRTKPAETKAGPEGAAFCSTCASDLGY